MRSILFVWFSFAMVASAANMVPNSSFEVGHGRGWRYYTANDVRADYYGELRSLSANVVTNAPQHGNLCWELTTGNLFSRFMWLTTGTYTVSAYLKTTAGSGTCNLGLSSFDSPTTTMPLTATVTTSWQRFTTNQVVSSNGLYCVQIESDFPFLSTTNVYVDAVQCEIGTTASTYAPAQTVECGLDTAAADNMLFTSDAKSYRWRFWNDGTSTVVPVVAAIYDTWNRKLTSSTSYVSVASGASTTTVSLPATNGFMRITSRLTDRDDSWDETTVSVMPFATNNSVSWLMVNGHYGTYSQQKNLKMGVSATRTLSPARVARWYSTDAPTGGPDIEHSEGVFTWTDTDNAVASLYTNGMPIMANLASGTGGTSYPPWATNKTIAQFYTSWSNFVYLFINRYTNRIYAAEIWNEPYATDAPTNNPFAINNRTNYAQMLELAAHVIKAASPTTLVLGFVQAQYGVDDAYAMFTNMSVSAQGKIDVATMHAYPTDAADSNSDPNNPKSDPYFNWWRTNWAYSVAAPNMPLWNTETGIYDAGDLKTLNNFAPIFYRITGYAPSPEATRNLVNNRSSVQVDREINHVMRCLGNNFASYTLYNDRHWHPAEWTGTAPNMNSYDGTLKPHIAALLIARKFISLPAVGQLFHNTVAANQMEMFRFTNSLNQNVIGIFNSDRTNRALTVTNSGFAVFDPMGNLITTNTSPLLVTRTAVWVVSGSLTMAQLAATLQYSTAATYADTNAPSVSIDIAPTGSWDTARPFSYFKWTGVDRERVVTLIYTNSVLFAWKLDGGSYTANSQSNHTWMPALTAGDHVFTVKATDESGNYSEEAYQFSAVPLSVTTYPSAAISGQTRISGKVKIGR